MRRVLSWMGLSAAVALELAAPRTAAACTCLITPIHQSEPSDTARDVPLNQAILIEGVFDPKSVRLEDESGNAVEFELNAGPWPGCPGTSADVIPKSPLAPNARYTVRVEPMWPEALSPGDRRTVEFTTGTTMLPDEDLEPPRASASMLTDGPEAMCGVSITEYICLGIDDPKDVELIMRRGDEVVLRTTTLVQSDATYGTSETPDCVELRRRAPTGKRSAPVKICGEALRPRVWDERDATNLAIECENGVIALRPVRGAPNPGAAGSPDVTEAGRGVAEAGTGARAEAGAGARADDNSPPSAADSDHRSNGCAAASGRDGSGAAAFGLLALVLCARRRRGR